MFKSKSVITSPSSGKLSVYFSGDGALMYPEREIGLNFKYIPSTYASMIEATKFQKDPEGYPLLTVDTDVVEWTDDEGVTWEVGDSLALCEAFENVTVAPWTGKTVPNIFVGVYLGGINCCSDIDIGDLVFTFQDGSTTTLTTPHGAVSGDLSFWSSKGFSVTLSIDFTMSDGYVFTKKIQYNIDPSTASVSIINQQDFRRFRNIWFKRTVSYQNADIPDKQAIYKLQFNDGQITTI